MKKDNPISVGEVVQVVKEVYEGTKGQPEYVRIGAVVLAGAALSFEGVMRGIGRMVGDADLPKKR
jgi:hypothetical protein